MKYIDHFTILIKSTKRVYALNKSLILFRILSFPFDHSPILNAIKASQISIAMLRFFNFICDFDSPEKKSVPCS